MSMAVHWANRTVPSPTARRSLTNRFRASPTSILRFWAHCAERQRMPRAGHARGIRRIFLVGLSIHGYEPVSVRFFTLGPDGAVRYLSERAIAENERSPVHICTTR